jgi:hypothetical protein
MKTTKDAYIDNSCRVNYIKENVPMIEEVWNEQTESIDKLPFLGEEIIFMERLYWVADESEINPKIAERIELLITGKEHYIDSRKKAYVSEGATVEALSIALWEKEEGKPQEFDRIQAIRLAIKERYPKS